MHDHHTRLKGLSEFVSDHHIPLLKTRPSVTSKPPLAFNPTLLNSVTEEQLLSSSLVPQASSGISEKGLSETSTVFQATRIPGVVSGSPWSTGSGDVFRPTLFKEDTITDDPNPDVPGNLGLTTSLSMGTDAALVSLSNPSFSPHPGQFMDLTNARETSTVMPYEPSVSITDNTVRSVTDSKITSHSEDETKWSPVTL